MPIYEIIDTESSAQYEVFMSYSALQEHLQSNPNLKQAVNAPRIVSGISGLTHKTDAGFNEVMSKIAENNPYTPHADKYGDKGVKASKTRDVVRKAKSNS